MITLVMKRHWTSVLHTACVCFAPKYNWSVFVFRHTQDIVELDSESIQVSNVQWSKVMMKSIIEKRIVNREIIRWYTVLARLDRGRTIYSSSRSLTWRTAVRHWFGIWKDRIWGRWSSICCEVETICVH